MLSLKLVSSTVLRNVAPLAGSQINTNVVINSRSRYLNEQQSKASITNIVTKQFSSSARRFAARSLKSAPTSDTNLKPAVSTLAGGYRTVNASIKQLNTIDLPVKPKKPPGPYCLFLLERKDEIMRHSGRPMTQADLSELPKIWNSLQDKTKYKKEYESSLQQYREEVESYKKSLTDSQKDVLHMKKKLLQDRKNIKKLNLTRPPKLPLSVSNCYTKHRYSQPDIMDRMNDNVGVFEIQSIISEEYRNLSPAEKEKYIRMHEEDKLRFKREFTSWYESVVGDEQVPPELKKVAEELRSKYQARNLI